MKNYYMVLIRKKGNKEDVISDTIFSSKAKAIREAQRWANEPQYDTEILLYDGEKGDELANYRATYTPNFIDKGY